MNIDRDSAQEEGAPTNSDDAQPGDHGAVPAVPADQEPPSAVRRVSSSRYPDLTKAQIRAAQAAIRLVNESIDAQLLRQTKEALASFQTRFAQLVAEAMADLRSLSARLTASAPNAIADLSAANAALTRQSEDLNRAVRAAIEAAAAPDTRAMLESLQFSLRLDPNILRRLRELVGRLVPPNVRDLTPEEVFGLVVSAGTHRLGVLYAISPDRLAELATADMPDEEVDALLDTFGDEEFAYIVAVLDRVREAEPEGLSALLVQAIEALSPDPPMRLVGVSCRGRGGCCPAELGGGVAGCPASHPGSPLGSLVGPRGGGWSGRNRCRWPCGFGEESGPGRFPVPAVG